jgi:L-Ala-D/L-Glu epimerase
MSIRLEVHNEDLRLKEPFRISGYTFQESPVTLVTLRDGPDQGRGEGSGVYYLNDLPKDMLATIENKREAIESGLTREELRGLLPPGGARMAVGWS